MKIMLFVETLSIGGLPNYVLDLARALKETGHMVAVAHAGDEVPRHLEVSEVSLVAISRKVSSFDFTAVTAWLPDLIHVHLCSDLKLLEGLRRLGVPQIRSFHDYTSVCLRRGRRRLPGDRCQRSLGYSCLLFGCSFGAPEPGSKLPGWKSISVKLAERTRYQNFEAMIVGSQYMRQMLLKNDFDESRIHLVPYFSKFDSFAKGEQIAAPKPSGLPILERPLELLFAGQAVAGKGLHVLMEALVGLAGNWRLTVVAEGPTMGKVHSICEAGILTNRVTFKAWMPQSELVNLYRQADLLIIPSVWDDPGPLVGLEAMSMGTPVLGFPVGGIPDYIIDGITGFLTREVSVTGLRQGLERAIAKASSLQDMGSQARKFVVDRHSRTGHLEQICKLYEDAIASHKKVTKLISQTRIVETEHA
jgi:glycosyltransferase involved in cell wall biosynthesis